MKKKIVILGAGFAGITLAEKLAKSNLFDITLVSPHAHFEYYPGLYRIMSNHIPFEVFVPMRYLVHKSVNWVKDRAVSIDVQNQTIMTDTHGAYTYDKVVIAIGSEPNDFGIPGVSTYAHFVSSLGHMIQAKNDIYDSLKKHIQDTPTKPFRIVVAGAGPTGVELTGELVELCNRFAKKYAYPREKLIVKIIQRDDRVLPQLSEKAQQKGLERLHDLGVRVLLKHAITSVTDSTVVTDTETFEYDVFFWSAGLKTPQLITQTPGLPLSPRKKVLVDTHFQVVGMSSVYVLGDNAETPFSGLAQIAEQDGAYMARYLIATEANTTIPSYTQRQPLYVVPIGNNFGLFGIKGKVFTGFLPWLLRYAVDMRFFFFALTFTDFLRLSLNRKLK